MVHGALLYCSLKQIEKLVFGTSKSVYVLCACRVSMKLQSFLWVYFPVVILGIVYTGLAALHACAEGRCWSGTGQGSAFSATVAGLAYTQVLPGVMLFAYVGLHVFRRDIAWKGFMELGWALRMAMVMSFAVVFALILVTIGLSFWGLVALRACALNECYPRLSAHAALAMFLCGQTTNLLIAVHYVVFNEEHWSDDAAIKYVRDVCNIKKRRQVCNLDQAPLPA